MDENDRLRGEMPPPSLREAIRAARIEAAERSGVIVELRDASLARLSMLNEMLDPIFADVPLEHADLFDRGLMPGETPRLFIDMVAHVCLARDRRTYRFLQDSRAGRRVLVESTNPHDVLDAVTRYVARRLIAREQAMVAAFYPAENTTDPHPSPHHPAPPATAPAARPGRLAVFILGLAAGVLGAIGVAALLGVEVSLR
ncbi:hypothetical protein [Ancylobacter amanitiformis]|uniref:Type IV / VI secretion system DotU domain-containing protein n=1 Tax=Ancylobacter amanitiformis TaxID=217069 RepID=A0ABU0LVW8_9HYPH|nr:hypothetical protein [Ancylobacter amanitiformis]MDQ0512876.1 hypothetical protein [Ancylobacter amanitiformis]